jgi:membrane protein DedA with SNARE-associated domain
LEVTEVLHEFINAVYGQLVGYEYYGIFVMMTLESSFIPFPSEISMIPAGIESSRGVMNAYSAIAVGTFGSWVGATVNYVIARFYGRQFLEKYGKYVRLDLERIQKMDHYFKNHGKITVFIIRFVPVVRQYISFPAGMAKMNFLQFSIYTSLGAGMWVAILVWMGYAFGAEFGEIFANKQINFELMNTMLKPHLSRLTIYGAIFASALVGIYLFFSKKYLSVQK